MDYISLLDVLKRFKGKRIGVLGDLMLDEFVWGEVERISPEAPVPIVRVIRETFMPGGAGNVASNVVSLGGKVDIVGFLGMDDSGARVMREFHKRGIQTQGVISLPRWSTICKTRVIATHQQVVRIDRESGESIPLSGFREVFSFITRASARWDAFVISDYAKGCITSSFMQHVLRVAQKRKKPVIGDTKPHQMYLFKGSTLLTPNTKEALQAAHTHDVFKAGITLKNKLKSDILITQGHEGMSLFLRGSSKSISFPADAKEVYDVSGAGDTVVAAAALCLASGAGIREAVSIANHAAGIVVGKLGTATVAYEELEADLLHHAKENMDVTP